MNGSIGKDWFYSGSIYQNFDPGSFKLRFAQYQDRTQIYTFALTKFYNEGRGHGMGQELPNMVADRPITGKCTLRPAVPDFLFKLGVVLLEQLQQGFLLDA